MPAPVPVVAVSAPVKDVPRSGPLLSIGGHHLVALPEGGLWWPEHRLLAVADLHLEKGSAFARRRQMLPPYDTTVTLARLSLLVRRLDPRVVVALGDSFHDGGGPDRLTPGDAETLVTLQAGRHWLWVAGNHDPDLPASIGGQRLGALDLDGVTFRHEPTPGVAKGEIAGHLHPAARVAGRAGAVRRRCFVGDGSRAVLPAFGAYAGGLNVLEAAFRPLFSGIFHAFVLGSGAVYPVSRHRLAWD
jgi:DNA ligase-associated metallophosphoesterase